MSVILADKRLLKILDNYTDALNKISVEATNENDFDAKFKLIKEQTALAIQDFYQPK